MSVKPQGLCFQFVLSNTQSRHKTRTGVSVDYIYIVLFELDDVPFRIASVKLWHTDVLPLYCHTFFVNLCHCS